MQGFLKRKTGMLSSTIDFVVLRKSHPTKMFIIDKTLILKAQREKKSL
jgi:hypothetical protein